MYIWLKCSRFIFFFFFLFFFYRKWSAMVFQIFKGLATIWQLSIICRTWLNSVFLFYLSDKRWRRSNWYLFTNFSATVTSKKIKLLLVLKYQEKKISRKWKKIKKETKKKNNLWRFDQRNINVFSLLSVYFSFFFCLALFFFVRVKRYRKKKIVVVQGNPEQKQVVQKFSFFFFVFLFLLMPKKFTAEVLVKKEIEMLW